MLVDAWLDATLGSSDRASECHQLQTKINLELGHLLRLPRHSRDNVARQEMQRHLVRVVQNDCVVDDQAEREGSRGRGGDRTRDL